MDQPLATYLEERLECRRKYDLYKGKVRIRGTVFLRSDYDVSLSLMRMKLRPDRFRIRSPFWVMGSVFLAVGLFALILIVAQHPVNELLMALSVVAMATGVVVIAASWQKVEFLHFGTGLMIAKNHRRADEFNNFTSALMAEIHRTNSAESGIDKDND